MSAKLSPINADEATKAAVVAYAAERGISQTKALAELVTKAPERIAFVAYIDDVTLPQDLVRRLLEMALERSQSPAETLSAALDALARPEAPPLSPAIVQPAEKPVRTWCGCDGLDEAGPHHRLGCERRTA